MSAIYRDVAWAVVAVLVTAAATYLLNTRLCSISEHRLARIRLRAIRHVYELPASDRADEGTGSLVSRVSGDIDTVSNFVQLGGLMLFINAGQLVAATCVMFAYSWPLAILVWICFLPAFLCLRAFQRRAARAYSVVRSDSAEMLISFDEIVRGAATVRSFAIENDLMNRTSETIHRLQKSQVKAQFITAAFSSSGDIAAGFANISVIVFSVLYGKHDHLSAGTVIAFLFLITLFISPAQLATELLNQAQVAIAGLKRILALLNRPVAVSDPGESGIDLPAGPISLQVNHVDFRYPGTRQAVLNNLNFSIAPSSTVAIVGATGSGKTTLANLLVRMLEPTAGAILANNSPLGKIKPDAWRGKAVMVPQHVFIFSGTLRDNVLYGCPAATDTQIVAAFTELGLSGWLASLPARLDTKIAVHGTSLSAGEQQLLALARVYLADPQLLLLDEATSAVDPPTEMRIVRALETISQGRTVITIAHRLTTAERADNVIVMEHGRIKESGTHSELIRRGGVYSRLHEAWIS
jgi:putative ABC transport system ATP-binding protein